MSWLTGKSAAEVVAREADLRSAAAEKARKVNGGAAGIGGGKGGGGEGPDEDDILEENRPRGISSGLANGGGGERGGGSAARYPDDIQSRPLWIHCTPLLGDEVCSDDLDGSTSCCRELAELQHVARCSDYGVRSKPA